MTQSKTTRHPICKSSDLADNSMMKVSIGLTDVCIGRLRGKLFACDNACPHKSASLSKGHFNGENVVCYMHGYEYNVFTGKLENMKSWKKEEAWEEQNIEWRKSGDLILFKITEEDGTVYVSLE